MRRPINTPPNREWLKRLFSLTNRRYQLYDELRAYTIRELPESIGKTKQSLQHVNKEIEKLEHTPPERLFLQAHDNGVRERDALGCNG